MSALLYYQISSDLTKDEIIEIDRQVANNREAAYLFVRELPSNSKRKVFVYGMFLFQLGQPLVPCATVVMMPLPPAIERLSPFEQDKILGNKNYYPQITPIINPRLDKIVMMYNNRMIPLISINGHYSYINEQLLKKLRAGDLAVNITVIAIGVVIYIMCQLSGVDAFQIITNWNAPQPSPTIGPGPSSSSTQLSVIPTKAQEFNDMSLIFNEPKTKFSFVMARDEGRLTVYLDSSAVARKLFNKSQEGEPDEDIDDNSTKGHLDPDADPTPAGGHLNPDTDLTPSPGGVRGSDDNSNPN